MGRWQSTTRRNLTSSRNHGPRGGFHMLMRIITCSHDTIGGISYSLVVTLPLEADLERPLRDYAGAVSILPCMSDGY